MLQGKPGIKNTLTEFSEILGTHSVYINVSFIRIMSAENSVKPNFSVSSGI
jgi:hypothetical protein